MGHVSSASASGLLRPRRSCIARRRGPGGSRRRFRDRRLLRLGRLDLLSSTLCAARRYPGTSALRLSLSPYRNWRLHYRNRYPSSIFPHLLSLPIILGPILLQPPLQLIDLGRHRRQLALIESIQQAHASHSLRPGRREAVVAELGLEPVRRLVLVGAPGEVLPQLRGRGSTVRVMARGLGEELAVGEGEAIGGDGRGAGPGAGGGGGGSRRHLRTAALCVSERARVSRLKNGWIE